ncbi:MAG: extensin family protein [Hyphomonadaceae bacterium]|nr:extensin family protein [Hyphomonadaceae bacterium]
MPWWKRAAIVAAVLVVLSFAIWRGAVWVRELPPEQSPFRSLDLERPVGWATAMQFDRIRSDPPACAAALDASRIVVTPIEDRREGADGQCGFSNAVTLDESHYPYSGAVRATCPLTAALYVWEREVVAPAAAQWLESPVVRIEMIGTYVCRNIYGRAEGRLSEHANANAIDIAGFRLENGRVIRILGGWTGDEADAAFLRAVRDGGCDVFRGVLSPDYNAAHADHLHLDMGPYRLCR